MMMSLPAYAPPQPQATFVLPRSYMGELQDSTDYAIFIALETNAESLTKPEDDAAKHNVKWPRPLFIDQSV